jgi:hypothetical protein
VAFRGQEYPLSYLRTPEISIDLGLFHHPAGHITMQKLEEAAKASEISTEEAARNINEGAQEAKSGQSQRR